MSIYKGPASCATALCNVLVTTTHTRHVLEGVSRGDTAESRSMNAVIEIYLKATR